MKDFTLALAQCAASCLDLEGNLRRIEALAEQAAAQGAAMLCLPELAVSGYALSGISERALLPEHPVCRRLSALACRCRLTLLAGLPERAEDGRLYITQLICFPDGRREAYRKTHPGERECAVFSRGDALPVFSDGNVTFGVALCSDNHYPEVASILSLKGAELVLAPFASPARAGDRRALWMKFLPARAYDSRIFLACCNLLGDNGMGTVFSGGAMAFSPDGGLLAEDFSGKEGLLLVSLSDAALRPYRQTARASMSATYFPAGRRPELYHL